MGLGPADPFGFPTVLVGIFFEKVSTLERSCALMDKTMDLLKLGWCEVFQEFLGRMMMDDG